MNIVIIIRQVGSSANILNFFPHGLIYLSFLIFFYQIFCNRYVMFLLSFPITIFYIFCRIWLLAFKLIYLIILFFFIISPFFIAVFLYLLMIITNMSTYFVLTILESIFILIILFWLLRIVVGPLLIMKVVVEGIILNYLWICINGIVVLVGCFFWVPFRAFRLHWCVNWCW